ncbi:MAG: hypothetical protein WD824_00345 [Cyclobacteriaceae bacterium]
MRKQLSSKLTFIYKFVIPPIWILTLLGLSIFIIIDSQEWLALLMLLMIFIMIPFINLKRVSYDDEYLYISNWFTEKKFDLWKLKKINEGEMTGLDPFFQLEIVDKDNELVKFDFMPRFNEATKYLLSRKLSGRLLELKQKIYSQS